MIVDMSHDGGCCGNHLVENDVLPSDQNRYSIKFAGLAYIAPLCYTSLES